MAIDADYKRRSKTSSRCNVSCRMTDRGRARKIKTRRALWILFETPVLAREARIYIYHVAGKLDVQVKEPGWPMESRSPKQDELRREDFGNASAPLGSLGARRAGLAVLVLRRRLQAGGSTRVPEADRESEASVGACKCSHESTYCGCS